MDKIFDKNSYLKSISDRNLKIYLMGELVEDPINHPIIKPSVEAMAETYELAVREPELASVKSPYTGESINRFLHIAESSEDLFMQNKMQRKLGQLTGTCFQRCVGMDAFNALHSVTFEIDEENKVTSFKEKPRGDGGLINGGFFILSPKVIDYIEDDFTIWEQEPLINLAKDNELSSYIHAGFWHPMDTLRDKNYLNDLYKKDKAPWKIW